MNEISRRTICDGVYFNSISDDKFKTIRLSVTMFLPLLKENAAVNAIVPNILTRTCAKYPDFTALNKRLCELYGAMLTAGFRKTGEVHSLTVSIAGLDDRYVMNNDKISSALAELLINIIFEPKLIDGAFCSEDLEQERRQLIDLIDSEFNEKRIYAANRCLEIMCKDEAFGISRYGSREAVEKLTLSDVYEGWQRLLKNSRMEIMVLGGSDSDAVFDSFKNAFNNINRVVTPFGTETVRTAKEAKSEIEKTEVTQSKLVMGFRAGVSEPDDDVMATRLMTSVLGGTPSSKFFLNIREKQSLCYYCSARYDRNKGIILVESGVETENIEKVKNAVLTELKAMQDGEISNFEIEAAKLAVANGFNSMSDTLGGMEAWYISQMLDREQLSPKEAAEQINAVTKEQIIAAANKVTLDTVYMLCPKD